MVKRFLIVLLLLAISPLLVGLFLAATCFVLVLTVYSWAALRWICWRTGNWHYLVYSSKRGWNDFLRNNLLPVRPHGVAAVAVLTNRSQKDSLAFGELIRCGYGVAKPYLAHVTLFGVYNHSLNGELWRFKVHAARNEELQDRLQLLIRKRVSQAI
jgi:hypothetical protein